MLLANLFRDQLDRYGELDTIADRWAAMVAALPAATQLALNADDPLIADLGRDRDNVTYFGVEDRGMASAEMQHAADSKHCRHCGAAYVYDAVYLGHLGLYRCPGCGRERPTPAVAAERVTLHGTRSASFTLAPPADAPTSRCRCRGSTTSTTRSAPRRCAWRSASTLAQVADGLQHVAAAFGRAERIAVGDHELSVLLIKNPAGANEILRTLALEPGELDLLGVLNDRTADGRDVSWIWDADFELLAGRVRRVTCAGTRAAELALRLSTRGSRRSASMSSRTCRPPWTGPSSRPPPAPAVYALPTYTALLELRERARPPRPRRPVLGAHAGRGMSEAIWHDLECGGYVEDLSLWR